MPSSAAATQASAITFLSTPGQAYSDGMRFVQFYLGLPIAMVILSITAVPIFHRLKVFTAYEYLETRFDNPTRTLTAIIFLVQRGLGTAMTLLAPALIVIASWLEPGALIPASPPPSLTIEIALVIVTLP